MRRFSFVLAIVLILCINVQSAFAIKAYPHPIVVTQPDGSSLTIRMHGDEFGHFRTTSDGFLIKKNNKGFYIYDLKNSSSANKSTEIIARDASKRTISEKNLLQTIKASNTAEVEAMQLQRAKASGLRRATKVQKAFPLNGSPKSLVILVNFKDKSYVVPTPQTAFTNLLNQSGYSTNGGTGSARDYFMAASYGKFSPQFDVVGPYTLPQNMSYYGGNDSFGDDQNPQQMVVDACTLANNAGLDFTQYDVDNDGFVDNVFIYYAGYNEAEDENETMPNTVWPHRWSLANYNTKFDGKTIFDYACTSELNGYSGSSMCGIGTFCHEFGHVLGLPDYYHTTSTTYKATLEDWSIMDAGGYNNFGRTPPTYSVYDRFYLGWLTPEQISTANDYTLLPIYQGTTQPANTNQQAYLLSATAHNLNGENPSPTEFFMLEYRRQTGWDAYLPGDGMLIWHIDYNATAWDDNAPNNYTGTSQSASSHMRVYLQPLSGSTTTPGAAFTTGSFTPTTWSGTNINRPITSITKTTNNVTFKLMGGATGPVVSTAGTLSAFSTYVGTHSTEQSFTVSGTSLTAGVTVSLVNQQHFDIKLSTDATWSKSVTIPLSGANASATVQVRFNPTAEGQFSSDITVQSTGATSKTVSVSGTGIAPYNPNAPIIQTGKVESTLTFTATNVSTSKVKTLNIKTTDLIGNLTVAVTGTNAAMFTTSVTSVTKETTNTMTGANITVTYQPTTIGQHTATLTISGGGLNPAKVITLTGEGK